MLKFPRKEEREKEKETEGKGIERKEGGDEEEREKGKGTEWGGVVYWERRRKFVKKRRYFACYQEEKYFLGPDENLFQGKNLPIFRNCFM